MLSRRELLLTSALGLLGPRLAFGDLLTLAPRKRLFLMDAVFRNPGTASLVSQFCDPSVLRKWGYDCQVLVEPIAGVPLYEEEAPGCLPVGSRERRWAEALLERLHSSIRAAKRAGLKTMVFSDLMLFPVAVVERFRNEICDERGRIDIERPKTKRLLAAQFREIFSLLPDLDGMVFRTGEVYLHDLPYHTAGGQGRQLAQGNTAIIDGPDSHIALLKVIREEICVRLRKRVHYRTWDFGNFHDRPDYYLQVTDRIDPHPDLFFSIKLQQGDFHQLAVINPTLGIGKHPQIVEVQAQREAYGKGAHPYYIGQGVIEGWEELEWMMKPGQPHGLRDLCPDPLVQGVWTWSRGGGWEGPFIPNELWCSLNAFVVAYFAQHPDRTEPEGFDAFCRLYGVGGESKGRFRELNLLSPRAVLRGQLTTLGARVDPWWARDDCLEAVDLTDFESKGLVEAALVEKAEAVAMWKRIEWLGQGIEMRDSRDAEYVRISCRYGRIKYALIEQIWRVLLRGRAFEARGGDGLRREMAEAIKTYDSLWDEWRQLRRSNNLCPTLYKDTGFMGRPGIGSAVQHFRGLA